MTSRVKAEARKVRAVERAKRLKGKSFEMKWTELPNMVDAIFDGDQEIPGWVIMAANAKGRDLVNGLFPQAHIEWSNRMGFSPDFSADWLGFKINLPDVVAATETKLPLEIIPAGRTIDDSNPDQLAFLLAFGVRRAGGRAGVIRQNNGAMSVEIFTPGEN